MYSKTVIAAAILSLASAQGLSGAAETVSSLAGVLSSLVNGFDGSGLSGALAIQGSYDPFSSAVGALNDAAGSATSSDITDSLSGTLGAITSLLDALNSKASDFSKVGASTIVQGDINGLSGPAGEIVSKLAGVGSKDQLSSLAPGVSSLADAFKSAGDAYSANVPSFPDLSSAGGSSESSAAAESSAAETSAAESSAAASAPAEASSSASAPAQANGAVAAGAGFAAAAAGVAALLI